MVSSSSIALFEVCIERIVQSLVSSLGSLQHHFNETFPLYRHVPPMNDERMHMLYVNALCLKYTAVGLAASHVFR